MTPTLQLLREISSRGETTKINVSGCLTVKSFLELEGVISGNTHYIYLYILTNQVRKRCLLCLISSILFMYFVMLAPVKHRHSIIIQSMMTVYHYAQKCSTSTLCRSKSGRQHTESINVDILHISCGSSIFWNVCLNIKTFQTYRCQFLHEHFHTFCS